jgi:hypothetical protein
LSASGGESGTLRFLRVAGAFLVGAEAFVFAASLALDHGIKYVATAKNSRALT